MMNKTLQEHFSEMCEHRFPELSDTFVCGNRMMGKLGKSLTVKIELVYTSALNNYDALKVTIINCNDGVVDCSMFHFDDIWGRKKVSNPNFPDGVSPHIWVYNYVPEWYAYKPTETDFETLCAPIHKYLNLFK